MKTSTPNLISVKYFTFNLSKTYHFNERKFYGWTFFRFSVIDSCKFGAIHAKITKKWFSQKISNGCFKNCPMRILNQECAVGRSADRKGPLHILLQPRVLRKVIWASSQSTTKCGRSNTKIKYGELKIKIINL